MIKKVFILSLIMFASQSINAQVDVVGGMGISLVYNRSLNQYLDYNWALEDVPTFNTSVEFYSEVDYSISEKYQVGFEYALALFGYNSNIYNVNYKMDYAHHKPSVLVYRVIAGNGYKFKFGLGIGPRIVQLTESIGATEQGAQQFSTTGFGLLSKVQGHTKLSEKFFANIGTTVRYDAPGEPENNVSKLINTVTNENVNINSFSISINIGISYFF